jgi:hypothetical protein
MTLGSGLNNQIGFGEESTWGVPVTPTVFLPIIDTGAKFAVDRVKSKGVMAGQRVIRSQQWSPGNRYATLSPGFELYDRSLSILFKHMFGTTSGGGPYTLTPGDLTGKGLTVELGLVDTATGTVNPHSYPGCKVGKWQLACKAGEIATLGVDLVARRETLYRTVADGVSTTSSPTITSATAVFDESDLWTPISGAGIPANSYIGVINSATSIGLSSSNSVNTPVNITGSGGTSITLTIGKALTAASYTSGISPMTFVSSYVTIAGTRYPVTDMTLSGDNKLNDKRNFLGSDLISEPLEVDKRDYTGVLNGEFLGYTAYNRFVRGDEVALVMHLANPSNSKTLDITMNVEFDGDTAKSNGPGIVTQALPFTCVGPSTDAGAITAVLSDA